MEFNSLLSKSAQKRIAEGESPADAVKPIVQLTQPTPEDDAAFNARLMEAGKNSVKISDLSKLSDAVLESWLR